MSFWNKHDALIEAIGDWSERGLVSKSVAADLKSDVASRKTSRSFNQIAAILGVVCLAFGAMTFVAANWQDMTSFLKVTTLFAALVGSWAAAILFRIRKQAWLAQTFVLLGCCLFGVIIMLLGQIYQLQGEAEDAVWLWWLGTLCAAVLTRSSPAFVMTCVLLSVWTFMSTLYDFQIFGTPAPKTWVSVDLWFLLYFAATALAAWWMQARSGAHLLAATLTGWVFFNVLNISMSNSKSFVLLLLILNIALILKAISLISDGKRNWLKTFERPALFYLFTLTLGLGTIWLLNIIERNHGVPVTSVTIVWPGLVTAVICVALAVRAWMTDNRNRYDVSVVAVFVLLYLILAAFSQRVLFLHEAVLLALTIWMIRMGWRLEYSPLTRWGIVYFAGVMLIIYATTIGTLISTSTFYLLAGLLILIVASLGPRLLEKVRPSS